MDTVKRDYRNGLMFFFGLSFCILLFFTTPDGVSLFDNLLGFLGISPGIPIGEGSTLFIYGLIPVARGYLFYS